MITSKVLFLFVCVFFLAVFLLCKRSTCYAHRNRCGDHCDQGTERRAECRCSPHCPRPARRQRLNAVPQGDGKGWIDP